MPKFSLVYPTRHRPHFVRQALRILEQQGYEDFEVVVSDNFVDPSLSCETICKESALADVRYVRPPEPLGMVANWNHALAHASGEYVCFFTDKMYLLPGALARVDRALRRADTPDIVNWASDTYTASDFDDYFGAGHYFGMPSDVRKGSFERFDPKAELDRKGSAPVPRTAQSPSHYARGKICFGAFHRYLIAKVIDRYGEIFQGINPDYTSMILGLTEAGSAIEMSSPCVVSISTDISNGQLVDTHDAQALAFLESLEASDEKLSNLMVPGLYSAISNLVAHDYLMLRRKYRLTFRFDLVNWLAYCAMEVNRPGRVWSSKLVEEQQKRILTDFIAAHEVESGVSIASAIARTEDSAVATEPAYVLAFRSLDHAIEWRKSRFPAVRIFKTALSRWLQRNVISHRWVQSTLMRPDWPGRRFARKLYRGLKERLE